MRTQGQRMAQAIHKIAENRGQMCTSIASLKLNGHNARITFRALIPVLNCSLRLAFEDRGHIFDHIDWGDGAFPQSLPDCFNKCAGVHRLQQDLIRLKKNCRCCCRHLWKTAKDERSGVRLGVPHRARNGQSVTGSRHMEVSQQNIERLRANLPECFADICRSDYVESTELKNHTKRISV